MPHAGYAPQRWPRDAHEKVPLSAQRAATIWNVRDPVTAVMIARQAFLTPTAQGTRKLPLAEVPGGWRAAFAPWGCPRAIQTDQEDV